MTFLYSLVVVAAMTLAATLTGRLLIGAAGGRLWRRLGPESAAGSLLLGTAAVVLLFDWLTLARLSAGRILVALAVIAAGLALVSMARGRLDVLRPVGPAGSWCRLGAPFAVALVLLLLPVLRSDDFRVGNDTLIYCSLSEWLQGHGYAAAPAASKVFSPVSYFVSMYQKQSLRLGGAYPLALAETAFGAPSSLLVYPAVSAFAVGLVMAGLLLALRVLLRQSRAATAAALLVFAIVPHAVYRAHHYGFLSQAFGLSALLLGTTLLGRSLHPGAGRTSNAFLIALAAAFLLCVYLPLLPVLATIGAYAAGVAWIRARRRGRSRGAVAFVGAAVAGFVALTAADWATLEKGTGVMATVKVGGHVALDPIDWLALVTTGIFREEGMPYPALLHLGGLLAGGLLGIGVVCAWRRGPRARLLLVGGLVLAAGLAYYALGVRDPWTLARGHTWNLFKLSQWAYPVVFLLQVGATGWLLRRNRAAGLTVAAAGVLLGLTAPGHGAWSAHEHGMLKTVLHSDHPLRELPDRQARLRALPPGPLVLIGRPSERDPWFGPYLALVAYPRPVLADWEGSGYVKFKRRRAPPLEGTPIPVACAPADRPGPVLADLGGGCAYVRIDVPLVVSVSGRQQLQERQGPLAVTLFAPQAAAGDLVIQLKTKGTGPPLSAFVEGEPFAPVPTDGPSARLRLDLPQGLTRVEIQSSADAPRPPAVGTVRFEPAR